MKSEKDAPPTILEYGHVSGKGSRRPSSFRFQLFGRDDLPVTILKYLVAAGFIIYLALILLYDVKS